MEQDAKGDLQQKQALEPLKCKQHSVVCGTVDNFGLVLLNCATVEFG
jgi:hypothetical protein